MAFALIEKATMRYAMSSIYQLVKYGTTDGRIITLIKNGFSRGVAELLLTNKYKSFVQFAEDDSVWINPEIHKRLIADKVGFLQRHEVSLNVMATQ